MILLTVLGSLTDLVIYMTRNLIFTVVPCILILSKFLHQLMHNVFKRSIEIYIKTALTRFGVIAIIRERTI